MQTGQDVSAKTLPSPSPRFRDRIKAELLGEASAALGCREEALPGLGPSLATGTATGKAVLPPLR